MVAGAGQTAAFDCGYDRKEERIRQGPIRVVPAHHSELSHLEWVPCGTRDGARAGRPSNR